MSLILTDDFDFAFDPKACARCNGRCCTGDSGYIWVNEEEMRKIADFLDMNMAELIDSHIIRVRKRFSLKEVKGKNGFDCVFFDNKAGRCSIYRVRPEQCRTYPFWNRYKTKASEVLAECPGVYMLEPKK